MGKEKSAGLWYRQILRDAQHCALSGDDLTKDGDGDEYEYPKRACVAGEAPCTLHLAPRTSHLAELGKHGRGSDGGGGYGWSFAGRQVDPSKHVKRRGPGEARSSTADTQARGTRHQTRLPIG
jgi:hypothetical protein